MFNAILFFHMNYLDLSNLFNSNVSNDFLNFSSNKKTIKCVLELLLSEKVTKSIVSLNERQINTFSGNIEFLIKNYPEYEQILTNIRNCYGLLWKKSQTIQKEVPIINPNDPFEIFNELIGEKVNSYQKNLNSLIPYLKENNPELIKNIPRITSLILGDSFIEFSGLEGLQGLPIAYYLLCWLKKSENTKENFLLIKQMEKLVEQESSSTAKKMETKDLPLNYQNELSLAHKVAAEHFQQIIHLKNRDSYLFSGGDSNHFTLSHITMQEETGTFSYYNSGNGIGFHSSFIASGKRKRYTKFTIERIPKKCLSEIFLKKLAEQVIPIHKKGKIKKNCMKEVYQNAFPLLKGEHPAVLLVDDFITEQRSGTCTIGAFQAFFRDIFSYNEYKKIIFELKFQALRDFIAYSSENRQPVENGILLTDCIHSFVRYSLKIYEEGCISFKEIFDCYTFISFLQKKQSGNSQNIKAVPNPSLIQTNLNQNQLVKWHLPGYEGSKVSIKSIFFGKEVENSLTISDSVKTEYLASINYPNFFRLIPSSILSLNVDLKETSNTIKILNNQRNYEFACRYVEKLVYYLLHILNINDLITAASQENLNECLRILDSINSEYFKVIFHLPLSQQKVSEQIIAYRGLVAIMVFLLKKNPHFNLALKFSKKPGLSIENSFINFFQLNKKPFHFHEVTTSYEHRWIQKKTFQIMQLIPNENELEEEIFFPCIDLFLNPNGFTFSFTNDELDVNNSLDQLFSTFLENNDILAKARKEWNISQDSQIAFLSSLFRDFEGKALPISYGLLIKNYIRLQCLVQPNYKFYPLDNFENFGEISCSLEKEEDSLLQFKIRIEGINFAKKDLLPERQNLSSIYDPLVIDNIRNHIKTSCECCEKNLMNIRTQLAKKNPSINISQIDDLLYPYTNDSTEFANILFLLEEADRAEDIYFQKLITAYIFSFCDLEKAVSCSFSLTEIFVQKLIDNYFKQKRLLKPISALFYLRLLHKLNLLAQINKDKTLHNLQIIFKKSNLQIINEFDSLADLFPATSNDGLKNKALVYAYQISSISLGQNLQSKEISWLIHRLIYIFALGDFEKLKEVEIEKKIQEEKDRIIFFLSTLDLESISKILNASINEIFSIQLHENWVLIENGIFKTHSNNSLIEIDFRSGTVNYNKQIKGFPIQKIMHATGYSEIFSNQTVHFTALEEGGYSTKRIFANVVEQFQFKFHRQETVTIHKFLDNKWFQFIDSSSVYSEDIPQTLFREKILWHWKENKKEIIIVECKEKQIPYCTIELFEGKILDIKRYAPQKIYHGASLKSPQSLSKLNNIFSKFQWFDDWSEIFFWGNELVEFVRFDFQFELSDKNSPSLVFSETGAFLNQSNQPLFGLRNFHHYLLLKHSNGKTYALIPDGIIEQEKTGPLNRSFSLIESDHKKNKRAYYLFAVENNKLIPQKIEEFLMAAYIYLGNKNYLEAIDCLKQKNAGNPQGYTEKEFEIAEKIQILWQNAQDNHPNSIAVFLHLCYLLIRNIPKEKERTIYLKDFDWKNLGENLEKYTSLRTRYNYRYSLSLEQETYLLKKLFTHNCLFKSTILTQRIKEINGESAGILIEASSNSNSLAAYTEEEDAFDILTDDSLSLIYDEILKNRSSLDNSVESEEILYKDFFTVLEKVFSVDPQIRENINNQLIVLKAESSITTFLINLFRFFAEQPLKNIQKRTSILNKIKLLKIKCSKEKLKSFLLDLVNFQESEFINKNETYAVDLFGRYAQKTKQMEVVPLPFTPNKDLLISLPSLQEWFQSKGFKIEEQIESNSDIFPQGLLNVFTLNNNMSSLQINESKLIQKDILTAFENGQKEVKKVFSLNLQDVPKIKDEINQYKQFLEKECQKYHAILQTLNQRLNISLESNILQHLRKSSELIKQPEMPDLVYAYLKEDASTILKYNPKFNEKDLGTLAANVVNFIQFRLMNLQLTKVEKVLENLLIVKEEKEQHKLIQLLGWLLNEKRHYQLEEKELLLSEFFSLQILRENQVEAVRNMSTKINDKTSRADQLIMNSGKTAKILPIICQTNRPFLIVPDQLFEDVFDLLRKTTRLHYNMEIEVISYPEERELSAIDLEYILDTLERMKQGNRFCLLKAKSIHYIYIQIRNLWLSLEKNGRFTLSFKMFRDFQKILKTFKEHHAQIDEIDSILDNLKEVSKSGEERLPIRMNTLDMANYLCLQIVSNEQYLQFCGFKNQMERPFAIKIYETTIKKNWAELLLNWISFQEGFLAGGNEREEILNYITENPTLLNIPDVIYKNSENIQNLIEEAKTFLNIIIPETLGKNSFKHYGPSKTTDSPLAIPYDPFRDNSPCEGSQFCNPFETLFYTIWFYIQHNIPLNQFRNMIDDLKNKALKESNLYNIDIEKTHFYKKYQSLEIPYSKNLMNIGEEDLTDLLKIFNSSEIYKLFFVRYFALEKILVYTEKITSNALHLVSCFKTVRGMSGTMLNKDTFHSDIKVHLAEGTDGKTLNILWKLNPTVCVISEKQSDNIPSLFPLLVGKSSLIDAGAKLRGDKGSLNNAKQLMNYFQNTYPQIKKIIFSNDQDLPKGTLNKLVVLNLKGEIHLYDENTVVDPDECFIYFNVTTGANVAIKQENPKIITIGKNTTLRDLLQAAWRDRFLDCTKSLSFAISEELYESFGCQASFEKILLFCWQNQLKKKEENYFATNDKITLQIDGLINEILLDDTLDYDELVHLAKCFSPFIIRNNAEDFFSNAHQINRFQPTTQALNNFIHFTMEKMQKIYQSNPNLSRYISLDEMKKNMENQIDLSILPPEIKERSLSLCGRSHLLVKNETEESKNAFSITRSIGTSQLIQQQVQAYTQNNNFLANTEGAESYCDHSSLINLNEQMKRNCSLFSYRYFREEQIEQDSKSEEDDECLFCEIFPIAKYLDLYKNNFFSSNLLVSKTYGEIDFNELHNIAVNKIPFKKNHNKPRFLLLLQNIQQPENIQLIFLTQSEAGFFMNLLALDHGSLNSNDLNLKQIILSPSNREINLGLIDIQGRILQEGRNPINKTFLKGNTEFLRLLVEAKFFAGFINYEKEEQQNLKEFIAEKGANELEKFLLNEILYCYPHVKREYEYSVLKFFIDEEKAKQPKMKRPLAEDHLSLPKNKKFKESRINSHSIE